MSRTTHDSLQTTVTQPLRVEVYQETHAESGQPTVRNDLSGVDGIEAVHGLQLDHHKTFHEKVDAIATLHERRPAKVSGARI